MFVDAGQRTERESEQRSEQRRSEGQDQPSAGRAHTAQEGEQAAPGGDFPVGGSSGRGYEEDGGKTPKSSGELRREIEIRPLMVIVDLY